MNAETHHVLVYGGAASLAGIGLIYLLSKSKANQAGAAQNAANLEQLAVAGSIPNSADWGAGFYTGVGSDVVSGDNDGGEWGTGEPTLNWGYTQAPPQSLSAAPPPVAWPRRKSCSCCPQSYYGLADQTTAPSESGSKEAWARI